MSEVTSHPAAGACPRMPESGGSYVVENGVRRQVEAPAREHPEGNGPRPAPSPPFAKGGPGGISPPADATVAAAIDADAAAEADEAAAPLKPIRKGVTK